MNEKQLAEIEARAAAATPGPWTDEYEYIEAWGADGLFIAHARDDVPALVAEVRRLRDALEEIADYDTGSYQSMRATRALQDGDA